MTTVSHEKAELAKECVECKGREATPIVEIPGGGKSGGIMIIGDVPTYVETQKGEYFIDTTAKFFARELHKIGGISLEDCYLTKAIKCYHPTKKVTKATIKNCRAILEREIEQVKPKHILLLGVTALETLLGYSNLSKHRGKVYDYNGINVVATVNPYVVLKQPRHAWEFRADLNYFVRVVEGITDPKDFDWELVETPEQLKAMWDYSKNATEIAYDIETTGLDPHEKGGFIRMIALAIRTKESLKTWVVSLNDETQPVLKDILEKGHSYELIAHNSKFDNRWLYTKGDIEVATTYDTFLASYLINVNIPHNLKYLAKAYLGAGDYAEGITFSKELTLGEYDAMAEYCALDSYYTLKLYDITKKSLKEDGSLFNVFKYIVMPGERILQSIEERGVYISRTRLKAVTEQYKLERDRVDAEIEDLLPERWKGGKINLNSTKQLGELLYEDLKLPLESRTATGAYATGRSVLLRMVDLHPLPKLILERRKYDKALVGFLTPWEDFLKRDGRLHSTYNIAKTATGRLSAENPNLQQVPRDPNVRSLVCAPAGKVFIEADYSQLELRVAAFVANATSMKECYRRGEDLHRKTASAVSHTALEDVTKAQRTAAKAVNFGYLYGMWWKSFKSYAFDSYGVVVTDKEAEESRKAYFRTYPELAAWHERQKEYVRRYKYVRTYTGRIRHLPDIDSPDTDARGSAERQAINTVVQSFGSDITLLAMNMIDRNIRKLFNGKAYLVGQVHDAIMVEADEDVGRDVALMVKKCMESVPIVLKKYFGVELDLPLVAEVEMGSAWGVGEIVE